MTRLLLTLGFVLLLLSPRAAKAEVERVIEASRILFGDVVPDAPPELADMDLGPAPPAGSSRLFTSVDISAAALQGGKKLFVKDSVRVVRRAKRWSAIELQSQLAPRLAAALPAYARLVRIEAPRALVTAPSAALGRVELGQLPNRRGTVNTSVMVEFVVGEKVEQRVAVPLLLELGDRPKPPEVERGTPVTLQISLGAARVSAAAVPLQNVTLGSTALFRVVKTRKTLRAKLLTPTTAEVVNE